MKQVLTEDLAESEELAALFDEDELEDDEPELSPEEIAEEERVFDESQ